MAARDVDLDEWMNGVGFHPADTQDKRAGHETVRALVGKLGEHLHKMLPPGHDKSLVFTGLEDVMMRANRALAIGGGPTVGYADLVEIMESALDHGVGPGFGGPPDRHASEPGLVP